jgi:hypothetical protein
MATILFNNELLNYIFEKYPLSIFNFEPSVYSNFYNSEEVSKLIVKCIKRDCELNDKKYFLESSSDEYIELYNNPNFILTLRMIQPEDYLEFLSYFCKIENEYLKYSPDRQKDEIFLHCCRTYTVQILELIKDFDIEQNISFNVFYSYATIYNDFKVLKWVTSLDKFLIWDERYRNEKSNKYVNLKIFELLGERMIKMNNFEMLNWFLEQNPPLPINCLECSKIALQNGQKNILNLLYSKNLLKVNEDSYFLVPFQCSMEITKNLYKKMGNNWDFNKICKIAIDENKLQVLEWCNENNSKLTFYNFLKVKFYIKIFKTRISKIN